MCIVKPIAYVYMYIYIHYVHIEYQNSIGHHQLVEPEDSYEVSYRFAMDLHGNE